MANMEYLNNYEKENLRQIRLKINRKTEPELLEWIEKQENIQGYIKQLIREDMNGRWNKFDPMDDDKLKDHWYYLIAMEGYETPMKAKWHSDLNMFEVKGVNRAVYNDEIRAWMEMPEMPNEKDR